MATETVKENQSEREEKSYHEVVVYFSTGTSDQ